MGPTLLEAVRGGAGRGAAAGGHEGDGGHRPAAARARRGHQVRGNSTVNLRVMNSYSNSKIPWTLRFEFQFSLSYSNMNYALQSA